MIWPPRLLACLLLLAFLHAGHADAVSDFHSTPQWKAAATQFDKRKASAAALLTKATRVEVYRLLRRGSERPQGKLLGGVPYYSRGKDLGTNFAGRLAAVTLDPQSYLLPGQLTKSCYLDPGVGFRVRSGNKIADVVVCFHCDELVVLQNDPRVPEGTAGSWIFGRFAVAGDFESARAGLLALAKEALPGVPEIQGVAK